MNYIIQLIVGMTITIIGAVYLFLGKHTSYKQIKDIFTPEEKCGVKLYRLNGKLHIWDGKFVFLYHLPILAIMVNFIVEIFIIVSLLFIGYHEVVNIFYTIILGIIEVFNFILLLGLSERGRNIIEKTKEPSWEEINQMNDCDLKEILIHYPNLCKNSLYKSYLLNSRPDLDLQNLIF